MDEGSQTDLNCSMTNQTSLNVFCLWNFLSGLSLILSSRTVLHVNRTKSWLNFNPLVHFFAHLYCIDPIAAFIDDQNLKQFCPRWYRDVWKTVNGSGFSSHFDFFDHILSPNPLTCCSSCLVPRTGFERASVELPLREDAWLTEHHGHRNSSTIC